MRKQRVKNKGVKEKSENKAREMLHADIELQSRLKIVSLYLAGSVILIGVLVLVGWKFNLDFFNGSLPGLIAMNPASAVAFVFGAVSFILLSYPPAAQWAKNGVKLRHSIGYAFAFIIFLIGLLKFLPLIVGFDNYIDSFSFSKEFQNGVTAMPGRPVPAAAINFILVAMALVFMNHETKKKRMPSQGIALLVGFIGMFSVIGYLYQVNDFYGWLNYLPMSIHAGICFIFLSLAILFAHPDKGVMAMHTTSLQGSILSRRFIPVVILVTIVLGYLRLLGYWMSDFTTELGTTLLILSFIIFLLILIRYNAMQLNKANALKKKVAERTKEISDYKDALGKSNIVAITDDSGIIKYVNDNFCKISKYSRQELIGQDHRIINSGYHPAEFIKNLWTTITNGKVWRGEIKNKGKDGSYFWVDTTIVPFLDEQGNPFEYVEISADITAKKETEDLLLDIGAIAHVGGWEINLDTMILRWTDEVFRIHELEPGKMPSLKEAINYYAPEARPVIQEAVTTCIANGKGWDLELPLISARGNHLWIRAIGKADIAHGKATRVYGVLHDVTRKKEAKDEINKLNQELEQKVKDRTEELESFSYSVSHDLRSPLRAVYGYTRMLEEDYNPLFDDEGKRLLKRIQQSAENMGILIDDLLAFSKLGRSVVEKSFTDMNKLTESVLSEINQAAPHHAEINSGKLLPAMADSALIRQVMTNLLSNAIKYSSKKEKPLIEIKSRQENGDLLYSVTDNGAGFDMKYAHKLFGVFERLHSKEEFPGTGVGLAISQHIIQKHGGKIWAVAKPAEGATFFFSLPDNK